jgi:ABC-type branched-subunit amino acid transport system substrate-binding protein
LLTGLIASLLLYILIRPPEDVSNLVYVHPICKISEINCGTRIPDGDSNPGIQSAFEKLSIPNIISQQDALKEYEKKWTEYRGKDQGAEFLIYLNNARLQASNDSAQKIFTLLVTVPRYGKRPKISSSILSGVAQVQKEHNENNKDSKLHIAILKEPSDDDISHKKLREIIKRVIKTTENENSRSTFKSNFIGAIGHYSSQITFSVLDIYAQNEILLISPGASRSGVPNSKNTLEHLNYFARTINNTKSQAYEMASWLKQLANNAENCRMLDIHLSYQEDDVSSMTLTNELKSLFLLTSKTTVKNVVIRELPYKLELNIVGDVEKKIVFDITNSLRLRREEVAKEDFQNTCKPKQMIAFFPGPLVTSDQSEIIKSVANIVPPDVGFIGNTTSSVISDTDVQLDIKNTGFYSRAYTFNPYNILDFLPSYSKFESSKAQKNFVQGDLPPLKSIPFKKEMINLEFIANTMKNNNQLDILNIDWRQISSTDVARVFSQAIKDYINKKDKYKNEKIPKIFHDIIKSEEFVAEGFYGNIQFDGYERKGTKTGTILKHIRRCNPKKFTDIKCNSGEIVAVPVGYRDPRNPKQEAENYKVLTLEDLVSLEKKSSEVN